MIAVRIEGRLGNQMFQYAFIYSASKKLQANFYIDKGIEVFKLYNYFEIEKDLHYPLDRFVFSIKGYKNIFQYHLRRVYYQLANFILLRNEMVLEYDNLPAKAFLKNLIDNRLYVGFYQSENYFSHCAEDIKKLFSLKKEVAYSYKRYKVQFPNDKIIVTIHIRKTDYIGMENRNLGGADLSLPFSYYHNAIKELNRVNHFFIFISDDQSGIEEEFGYLPFKYISYDDEIIDFQHMLHADICIIANSTFSWWAAYLNKNPQKKVIAPQHFLGWRIGTQVPLEIYPSTWALIKVG
ncbi:alpha-1,2-fucosyltransferase [Parasediminibacterium sp. JCM 36343]|uniref:alpha-1,2-fucosyltransferase n=1 Tax=Parasediminibacterium sp. JCM 36343 TaxID=3374279 RepID=UPI00397910A3